MLRYRCHVGHAYSAEALSDGQSQMLEVALWSAVGLLKSRWYWHSESWNERAKRGIVHRSMFERRAREAEEHGSRIRQLLLSGEKGDIDANRRHCKATTGA